MVGRDDKTKFLNNREFPGAKHPADGLKAELKNQAKSLDVAKLFQPSLLPLYKDKALGLHINRGLRGLCG